MGKSLFWDTVPENNKRSTPFDPVLLVYNESLIGPLNIFLHLRPKIMALRLNAKNKDRLVDPLYGFDADRIKGIIEKLELDEMEKDLMCYRWLVRVENMEKDARKSKIRHHIYKMIVIVGSAIVPVLVSLNNPPSDKDLLNSQTLLYLATLFVSMVVSISAGVHEFFRYGDRWRHYRGTVENLKSEGWHFIQQTGRYRTMGSHGKAYKRFAERIERILARERERFMSDIAKEKTIEGQEEATKKQAPNTEIKP